MVFFLLGKKLLVLSNDLEFTNVYDSETKRKNGKFYIPKTLYGICNFDFSLLPRKLNLPMVCRPRDWDIIPKLKEERESPQSLSDLSGGYLSQPIGDFYYINRYNLLSSRDLDHFHITLDTGFSVLCNTMNYLQAQAFEINVDVLNFINKNYDELVKSGLLMPRFLATLNIAEATNLLRKTYIGDTSMRKVKYEYLLKEFMLRIQRSRYERFLLEMASAYAGRV